MVFLNTQNKVIVSLIMILVGAQVIQPVFVQANSVNTPIVTITPQSADSDTIFVTFPNPIPAGNIIDLEIINSSNNKIWQQFTDKGGDSYATTTSQLSDGTYTLKGGLFTANWQSNIAWFDNLATIIIPAQQITIHQTTQSETTTPVPSPTATDTPGVTPTPQSEVPNQSQSGVMEAAMTAYQDWKNRFLVSVEGGALRVQRPENSNDTVSEGIGYGMLLSVFAKDQSTFDGLWNYAQKHLDSKGLMNWDISSTNDTIGSGSATDADEDMAYALTRASLVWPDKSYDVYAKQLISAIKKTEVTNNNLINPGDNWGSTQVVNPSYIAPSYYRAFAQITGDAQWNDIAQKNSDWIAKAANVSTGLLPDWINADLSPASNNFDQHQHDFWYDAIRTPMRMLMTYTTDKDANAQSILQKEMNFFNSVGTDKLLSGYTLSGTPLTNYIDNTFISGYTAAGQIDPASQYAQTMLTKLIAQKPDGYFGSSLRALTLFLITHPQ